MQRLTPLQMYATENGRKDLRALVTEVATSQGLQITLSDEALEQFARDLDTRIAAVLGGAHTVGEARAIVREQMLEALSAVLAVEPPPETEAIN